MNMQAKAGELESYAQFAEDRILAEIFGERTEGWCVEIGANDGCTGSASYLFERRGWQCLLVEPIPALCEKIRKHRACKVVNCAASSREGTARFFVAEGIEAVSTLDLTPEHEQLVRRSGGTIRAIEVRTATLDSLLEEAGCAELDFITIDVEGHELSVLEGFDLGRHRPRVVILEDNSVAGNVDVKRHMAEHGYVHFRRTGVNEWYAHKSDFLLVKPEEIMRFERAKRIEHWHRRRRQLVSRIATFGGRCMPDRAKRRLRCAYEIALRKRS